MRNLLRPFLISIASISLVLTACGGEEASVADGPATIVVTTNILGDVVEVIVGDQANVETIMPLGADPHVFQASAQQVELMMNADLVVANGESFEEGILDVLNAAKDDGVTFFEAMDLSLIHI